jgi:hypothetical protein
MKTGRSFKIVGSSTVRKGRISSTSAKSMRRISAGAATTVNPVQRISPSKLSWVYVLWLNGWERTFCEKGGR